jgi:hypothetical protein
MAIYLDLDSIKLEGKEIHNLCDQFLKVLDDQVTTGHQSLVTKPIHGSVFLLSDI